MKNNNNTEKEMEKKMKEKIKKIEREKMNEK